MVRQVTNDSTVLLHFSLTLEDGTVAESTYDSGKPALFCLGNGSLSTELEKQLLGLRVGDKHHFSLVPEDAFGVQNPDLIQFFHRRDFVQTGIPEQGTIMQFTSMDGRELAGVIRDVACDSITVDFNHPLAGCAVTFEIEVIDIDPSVPEIKSSKAHADIAS